MSLSFPPKTTFAPVNACIYCGARGPGIKLTDEHIVPLSLGGTYVVPKASCLACADKTKNLEGYAARQVFQDIRVEYGFPTRRPKERPTHLPLRESFSPSPEAAPIRLVPTKDYPGTLILLVLEPAGILAGRSPEEGAKGYPFVRFIGGRERVERLKEQGIDSKIYREFKPDLFLRLIAKIGLGFAVAAYGLDNFEPTVRDVILRRDTGINPFYWVGGVTKDMMGEFPPPSGKLVVHRIVGYKRDIAGVAYLVMQVQLFAGLGLGAPCYAAIVGKLPRTDSNKPEG